MKPRLLLFCFLFLTISAKSNIILPKIFSSNMVLQRDQPLRIWGWADKGEKISIELNGQKVRTTAAKDGSWLAILKPQQAGGPYELKIEGKNSIRLSNLLIGDVYLCSGQSNMEWPLRAASDAATEIPASTNPNIRLFTVQKAINYFPQKDVTGGTWQECNPTTSGDFSAVAYFFGKKIALENNVPVGLIHSSWGGTNIQGWLSWDIMSKDPKYTAVDLAKSEKIQAENEQNTRRFQDALKNDQTISEKWFDPAVNSENWKSVSMPQYWEATSIGEIDGIIWFRKEVTLTEADLKNNATLALGRVDDIDETFINGTLVGSTSSYLAQRQYPVAAGILKPGKNVIAVKVTDTGGGGGLTGKPEDLYLEINGRKIPLAGEWTYKASVLSPTFGIVGIGPNAFPSLLYNGMIAPLIQYPIKGTIWYQGENNVGEAFKYRQLFKELIHNWRTKWNAEFPFLWVQLANYMYPDSLPQQSGWAELREAQSMTLALPKTGQAVIIDIGEAADIHPRNKKDVGARLALAAEKTVYGKNITYSGPTYTGMRKQGDKIYVRFGNTGKGLIAKDKYGYPKGFSIAGADGEFVWAMAYIMGDEVLVHSPLIKEPVAVRYAWGNNPSDANLYNAEGLPASPFRTDSFKGVTEP